MLGLIKNLKNKYNLQIQYLHCDNMGENVIFKKVCKQEGLGVDFEYSVPSMPQQNGYAKRKFATLFNLLNGGQFNAFLSNGLWAKAANTATLLKNSLLTLNRTLSLFQQFLGRKREASCLQSKIFMKCVLPPTGITL